MYSACLADAKCFAFCSIGENWTHKMPYENKHNFSSAQWMYEEFFIPGQMTQPYIKKEEKVNHDSLYLADQALAETMQKRETERLVAEKLAIVDAFGEDTFEVGTVLTYTRNDKGNVVNGIVRKTDDDTWTTQKGYTRTWESLLKMLVTGKNPVTKLTVMKADYNIPA